MDTSTQTYAPFIKNPIEKKIEQNLAAVVDTVAALNQLKPRQQKKMAGQVYKGWILIFEVIKLITYLAQQPWEPGQSTSEIMINNWMEKISRLEQELAFYARRNNVRKINPQTKVYLTGMQTP